MSRAFCEVPVACRAKSEKMCHRCMMIFRNQSDKQRAAVSAEKLKNPTLTDEVKALSHTREVRQKACDTRNDREMPWCPREYRPVNAKLRSAKVPLAERKAEIARMIADDANRPVVLLESMSERIARSHDKMKRGGRIIGGSIKSVDRFGYSR